MGIPIATSKRDTVAASCSVSQKACQFIQCVSAETPNP